MSSPSQTIRPLPEVDETRAPQILPFLDVRAETAELRDRVTRMSADVEALHNQVQNADVERRTSQLAQSDPSDLLAVVADELGMSWSLLAELVGVTPTAIRKWRRGTMLTPDNRRRLARVIAFCEVLRELNPRITDAALWLETPLTSSTTLRPADLYVAGLVEPLLDVVADRLDAEETLDRYDPEWRERYPSDSTFEVIQANDGLPSIVPRP